MANAIWIKFKFMVWTFFVKSSALAFRSFHRVSGFSRPGKAREMLPNDDDKVPGSEEKSNFSGHENLGGGKYSNDPDLMLNALRFLPFNIFPSKPN